MTLRWVKPARLEVDEAVEWYEFQSAGLGGKLLAEIDAAIALIERFPKAWHKLSKRTRSHRLNRFPYSLIYTEVSEGDIAVIAFVHQHRRPGYWRDRLRSAG